jgi:hypothetical protein
MPGRSARSARRQYRGPHSPTLPVNAINDAFHGLPGLDRGSISRREECSYRVDEVVRTPRARCASPSPATRPLPVQQRLAAPGEARRRLFNTCFRLSESSRESIASARPRQPLPDSSLFAKIDIWSWMRSGRACSEGRYNRLRRQGHELRV